MNARHKSAQKKNCEILNQKSYPKRKEGKVITMKARICVK
jgi:hypothetical protein